LRVEDADSVTRGLVLRLRVEEKRWEGHGEEAEGSSHYKKVILLIEAGPCLINGPRESIIILVNAAIIDFIDKVR
jgi:hypothetical protein